MNKLKVSPENGPVECWLIDRLKLIAHIGSRELSKQSKQDAKNIKARLLSARSEERYSIFRLLQNRDRQGAARATAPNGRVRPAC